MNTSIVAAAGAAGAGAAATTTTSGVGDSTDSASHGASPGTVARTGGAAEGAAGAVTPGQENTAGSGGGAGWSFARVTAMNGHFPSLNPTGPGVACVAGGNSGRVGGGGGAWGGGGAVEVRGGGAWGTPKTEGMAGRRDMGRSTEGVDGVGRRGVAGDSAPLAEGGMASASAGTSKKKGKKGKKAVSLFSNAGVRGGR